MNSLVYQSDIVYNVCQQHILTIVVITNLDLFNSLSTVDNTVTIVQQKNI